MYVGKCNIVRYTLLVALLSIGIEVRMYNKNNKRIEIRLYRDGSSIMYL